MNLKHLAKTILLQAGALLHDNRESKVIYYHDIHAGSAHTPMSTPLELFETHLDIAESAGYRFVAEITQAEGELELTFDDGFRGLYENFSLFVDRKIPVRIFIVSDFIGKKGYLLTSEIREMIDTGLLHVGSHGQTHRNLDTLSREELIEELTGSKKRLEELLSIPVETLCFPRGRFSDPVLEEAVNAGYTKLYSCLPGAYHKEFKPGLVHRSLVQHATPSEFKATLKGGDRIYYSRYLNMHYHRGKSS
ncbi:polysaccharide deacetylase family protein [Hydrogenimonas sp.]